jgi:tetrahydromethanopterin S-methyltransferase subunit A
MTETSVEERIAQITRALATATAADKCHSCGCFHDAVEVLVTSELVAPLAKPLAAARRTVRDREADCKGCASCWPADVLNVMAELGHLPAGVGCSMVVADHRDAWPRRPGDYRVLRHPAPVAVCTLHTRPLVDAVAALAPPGLSIVGSLQTENLGIEHLIDNVVANPHIRFLLLCGADTKTRVGHLPGQALLALARDGVDRSGRIRGARGVRPVLKNLERPLVDHFRGQVQVVDRRGLTAAEKVVDLIHELAGHDPGVVTVVPPACGDVRVIRAEPPVELILDPAGYVVIYLDRIRHLLAAEHYRSDGLLDTVIEGDSAVAVMATLLRERRVSRLDHTAYLSRELTRAEDALRTGGDYVQDQAPGG